VVALLAACRLLDSKVEAQPSPSRPAIAPAQPIRRGLVWGAATAIATASSLLGGGSAQAGSFIAGSSPGEFVTPSRVEVFLEPDDPVHFTVEVAVGNPQAIDLFLLNDLSASFGDDLPNVRSAAGQLMDLLEALAPDVRMGVGSFTDKPVYPFGGLYRHTDGNLYAFDDYAYQTHLALTDDRAALQTAVDGLQTRWGLDAPESQLEALMQMAVRSRTELGFRPEAFKAVVLQTDACFHVAQGETAFRLPDSCYGGGDRLDPYGIGPDATPFGVLDYERLALSWVSGLTANNGDAVLDAQEDYPAIAMVRQTLLEAGIVPIFAVTNAVGSIYQGLVDILGFGQVVELSADSSNLVSAVQQGLQAALNDVKLFVEDDDYDYVRRVGSDLSGEKSGADLGVASGDRARFDITLEDRSGDGLTGDDTLYLTATGYGRTTVNVTVPRPAPEPTPEPTPEPEPSPGPAVPPAPTPGIDPDDRVSVPEPSAVVGLGFLALLLRGPLKRRSRP
jgi:hypothetical protein